MLYWLSNPKVRLGLLVNGLYLASLLLSPTPHRAARTYPGHEAPGFARIPRPPVSIHLPPPAGPPRATAYRAPGASDFTVYLEKDLTLLGARGRRLLVSPTYTLREGDGSPESVLLRFVSFSGEPLFTDGARFVISADGRRVWPAYEDGRLVWEGWTEEAVPPHLTLDEDGGVVENVGKAIPYEVFAQVISARRVVVNLGPHLMELNEEHLDALRDMHRILSRHHPGVREHP
jgi:hypothetical protein